MRAVILATLAALTVGTIAVAWTSWGQAPRSGQSQSITHRKGVAIATVAEQRAKEGLVVVEKDQPPPMFVEAPPGVGDLEFLTSIVDAVVVVRVVGLDSSLTQPDRDWVSTVVNARIDEVLKKPAGSPLAENDRITFLEDGGEVQVGRLTVRAVLPYADAFEIGQRYILFGLRDPADLTLIFGLTEAYRIDPNDTLVPLTKVGPRRASAALPVATAKTRIRSVKGAH